MILVNFLLCIDEEADILDDGYVAEVEELRGELQLEKPVVKLVATVKFDVEWRYKLR